MLINSLLTQKKTRFSQKYKEDMIDLCAQTFYLPQDFNYKVLFVNRLYTARPDLLSYHLYGDERYGDLLCRINGISNPFELNENMLIIAPEYQDLEKFLCIDSFNNEISDQSRVLNKSTKNKSRTANEVTTNDTRFRVDQENRVIIY